MVLTGRADDISARVRQALAQTLDRRTGRVVPEPADLTMTQGVDLEATYVYADMAGSSKLAHSVFPDVAAKIIKSYVNTATHILNHWGGAIRSFDGDRVMSVFIGDDRNWKATRASMEISWAVNDVIWPAIQATWSDTANWGWTLGHGVGIDTGNALLIRTGVRGDNDLASIGTAPNVAAKLSELRGNGQIYITKGVFEDLDDSLWYGPAHQPMWTRLLMPQSIGGTQYSVYSTSWNWGA